MLLVWMEICGAYVNDNRFDTHDYDDDTDHDTDNDTDGGTDDDTNVDTDDDGGCGNPHIWVELSATCGLLTAI